MKQEPFLRVAIAPTPSTQRHQTADSSNQMRNDQSQAKAALEIVQQPPETWYKDQSGRKATFELQVKRTETFCAQCVEQRILAVQLLYESGKVVEKQEILHVMAGQCLDQNKQSTLAVRIAQVSKNHLNQRFRVEIAVPPCPGQCEYAPSVVSGPVLVLSKKKKKKKRAVKENAETEFPSKAKKVKRSLLQGTPKPNLSSDLLESLQSSASTATMTGNVTAVIAEMEETIPPQALDATAPFTPETPNLCLWANAAFDLLYKLQWQRVPASTSDKSGANLNEILAQALSKAYKCPSCQKTYGQMPTHQDDCDLKLLLEQGGHTDVSTTRKAVYGIAHHPLQGLADKNCKWPDGSKAGEVTLKSPYHLTQNLLHLSGPVSEKERTKGVNSTAVAANLNIGFRKDYASLSKLLYSTTYSKAKSSRAGTASNPAQHWTGIPPPAGTLSPGSSFLPRSTNSSAIHQAEVPQSYESQRFSGLLSATMDMPPDAAGLFRASEASLHGDGNIVNSLGSMNMSDIIRSNSGKVHSIGPRFTSLSSSLSTLLSRGQSNVDVSSEERVQIVMGSDFLDCGFPALDASFNLVGFYQLVTETTDSPAELRFAPNLFPLPVEMLQELTDTITQWKEKQSIIHKLESVNDSSEDSLARLKSAVLRQVTHSKSRLE